MGALPSRSHLTLYAIFQLLAFILIHYMVNRIGFCYVNLVNKMKSLKGVLDSVEDSVVIIEPESSEVLYSNKAAKVIRIRT